METVGTSMIEVIRRSDDGQIATVGFGLVTDSKRFATCAHVIGPVPSVGGRWVLGESGPLLPDGRIQVSRASGVGYWLQPGFSGSPLYDATSGTVLGIAVAID